MLLQRPAEGPHVIAALRVLEFAPGAAIECLARGRNGALDVGGLCFGYADKNFLGRRRDHVDARVARRLGPFPTNEKAVRSGNEMRLCHDLSDCCKWTVDSSCATGTQLTNHLYTPSDRNATRASLCRNRAGNPQDYFMATLTESVN